jgi:hypothetical protein
MLAHVENRITYSGNGNATEFAYQFKILNRTDIKVLLTDADGKEKLLTKDYYVDVEKSVVRYPGYAVGAEVPESERPPALPTGWKLTIYREVPVTQETDLPDQYPFNQVEAIGDKLTMIAQQLTDTTDRSLKIGVSKSTDIDTVIPWENGKSFRISDDGKTLELSEDPAKVLPLAQGVYAQTQAQAQIASASAAAAAKSEDSAFESAGVAGNSAQYASLSAASAAENAELTSGYKQEALTAKADATASATNAKASEANAKTSENNAEASKEAAQSAATTASNYASASRGSANEAQTFKTTTQTYMNNAELYMNNAKNYSENVNVFIPSVSSSGVLSWTNKAGLDNPASVNIKGAKGDKGDAGAQGIQGAKGDKGDKGEQGLQGIAGTAATIRIGSVYTGEPGTNASVSNSGTSTNAILNFTIPRGNPGSGGGSTVDVDAALSDSSLNPVQNKVIKEALDGKLGKTETAAAATHDGAGNVIVDTYAKKTDITNITVDSLLSSTSTNPVQNKVIYSALADKMSTEDILSGFALLGGATNIRWREGTQFIGSINAANYSGTARAATHDGAGNVIVDTYAKKTDITNITVDSLLSSTSTNPVQNKVIYSALADKMSTEDILSGFALLGGATNIRWREGTQFIGSINAANYSGTARAATHDGAGNVIVDTYAKKADVSGVVKSVNDTKPDASGNVTIAVSGGGVSTSESNTWSAQQNFHDLMLNREKYTTYVINGTSDTPITSTVVYAVTGAFTLDLATLAGALSASQSSVFTAYFAANADYSLTISNAGKLKYVGSASDVAITSAGLLLNIWMSKDGGGTLTSIVQANKLGGDV